MFLVGLMLVASACGTSHPTHAAAKAPTTTTSTPTPAPPPGFPPPPPGSSYVATPKTVGLVYSHTAGGPSAAQLPIDTWGKATVRPVVDVKDGWAEIQLDTRPNTSTGWVPLDAVTLSTTPYRIVVSISQRSLTLYLNGEPAYSAPVGVGRPQWPTPVGPSFVDAVVATPSFQTYIYGPTVLILGLHSDVFKEFEGGDGVVAIHGYPSDPASTRGVASSHGCIRASPQTIAAIAGVPAGSPVDVID